MTWLRQPSQSDENPSPSSPPERSYAPERQPAPEAPSRTDSVVRKKAVIGPSIKIKGQLSGDESLTIDGTVEGKISLEGHTLTLGSNARIKADVKADAVVVAGDLTGNIDARERVEIAPTGVVRGDVATPRISIADGASLKGSVDTNRNREVAKMEMPKTPAQERPEEKVEKKATA
jgi:cytoskeletal protein CcmA (bactofilin family)